MNTLAGFDLSYISPENWNTLRGWFFLDHGEKTDKGWVWSDGIGNVVVTANNPLTGFYYHDKYGRDTQQMGYAGYVGIEGDEDFVTEFFHCFARACDTYKEADFGRRQFI